MTKFESDIKQIHYPQASVFAKLADLRNLEGLKERLGDPAAIEQLRASGQVPEDKLSQIQQMASQLAFTEDTISIELIGMGSYLDDAFLNGSYILSRAEKVILLNDGKINLSYSGNYTASSNTALRKGLGGIVGIRADGNTEATNNGIISITLQESHHSYLYR